MTIPLPLSPGRSGFTPGLQLAYDSGVGQRAVRVRLEPGHRRRSPARPTRDCRTTATATSPTSSSWRAPKTSCPCSTPAGGRTTLTRTVYGIAFQIAFYRPRIEGAVLPHRALDRHRTPASATGAPSRATTSPRFTAPTRPARSPTPPTPPGSSPGRSAGPGTTRATPRIYSYAAEDGAGIDLAAAHEANRTPATRAAQTYLKTVQYGNLQPYFPDWTAPQETPLPADWMFSVVLDYGDHAAMPPGPAARPALAAAPRPVLHLSRRIRDPHLPARPAAAVLQQLPRGADRRRRLPRPVARPGLLRPAGPCRSPQPDLHLPRLGDPDRLPATTATGSVTRSMPPLEFEYSQPQIQPGGPDPGPRQPGQSARKGWTAAASGGSISTARACPGS